MFDNPASTGLEPDQRLLETPAGLEWCDTPMIESYLLCGEVAAQAGAWSAHIRHSAASPRGASPDGARTLMSLVAPKSWRSSE
jgi:hypothetical protein